MGYGNIFGTYGTPAPPPDDPPKIDPLTVPLSPEHPKTWTGREDRVRWVLHNFTPGEQHQLFRLLHDANRVRYSTAKGIEERERKALGE